MLDKNEVSGIFVNDFVMWDTDDDGVLSEDEFKTTFFGNTDANDDDAISEDEWDLGFSGLFGNYFADTNLLP